MNWTERTIFQQNWKHQPFSNFQELSKLKMMYTNISEGGHLRQHELMSIMQCISKQDCDGGYLGDLWEWRSWTLTWVRGQVKLNWLWVRAISSSNSSASVSGCLATNTYIKHIQYTGLGIERICLTHASTFTSFYFVQSIWNLSFRICMLLGGITYFASTNRYCSVVTCYVWVQPHCFQSLHLLADWSVKFRAGRF